VPATRHDESNQTLDPLFLDSSTKVDKCCWPLIFDIGILVESIELEMETCCVTHSHRLETAEDC